MPRVSDCGENWKSLRWPLYVSAVNGRLGVCNCRIGVCAAVVCAVICTVCCPTSIDCGEHCVMVQRGGCGDARAAEGVTARRSTRDRLRLCSRSCTARACAIASVSGGGANDGTCDPGVSKSVACVSDVASSIRSTSRIQELSCWLGLNTKSGVSAPLPAADFCNCSCFIVVLSRHMALGSPFAYRALLASTCLRICFAAEYRSYCCSSCFCVGISNALCFNTRIVLS